MWKSINKSKKDFTWKGSKKNRKYTVKYKTDYMVIYYKNFDDWNYNRNGKKFYLR